MLSECLFRGGQELVGSAAGSVQLQQQRVYLLSERGFDDGELPQLRSGEDGVQPVGPGLEVAPPTGSFEQAVQPGLGQLGCGGGVGCGG